MTTVWQGVETCKARLLAIPGKLRRNALRRVLTEAAKPVQQAIYAKAPVLNPVAAVKNPYRRSGAMRKAIKIRASKYARQAGNVGVFINVKQLPGSKYKRISRGGSTKYFLMKRTKRSAHNPNDVFYARFVQWGTKYMEGRHFLEAGPPQFNVALAIFESRLGPILDRLNTNGDDPL